jgi:phospholipid/cholesterol/gamma-HCH transport system ATP-binding protein
VIVAERLTAAYGERVILHDVSFRLGQGCVLAVVGPSGCGKSTLLRCLVGLLRPTTGRVSILGKDLAVLDRHDLDELRRRFGVAFQGSALLNSMTIADNVALPLREHTRLDEATIRIMTRLKLEQVGLGDAGDKVPSELSGGMRKRAGIARALAMDPQVLFLDEPSAGLDPITAAGLDNLIDRLRSGLGLTLVVVTHELDSIRRIADRILMLDDGRVRLDGTMEEAERSRDPRVRQFFDRRADTDAPPSDDYVDELAAPDADKETP